MPDGDRYGCFACGGIFSAFDFEDWDDMHCPECGSNDIGGSDDFDGDEDAADEGY
jgi:hypothetical protein